MSLIVTEKPFSDESGFGYYRRLASKNSLASWHELASHADVARSRSALMGCPEHMASALEIEFSWAQFANLQENCSRQWRGLHRVKSDAICPLCLEVEPYLRHYWEHSLVTACVVHRSRLVDKCPACNDTLSQKRERIEQCQCGHDLVTCTTAPASDSALWLSSLIESGGRSSRGVKPCLQHVDLKALSRLVRILCIFADPSSVPARRRSLSTGTLNEAIEVLRPLEKILWAWPTGFEEHVSKRITAGDRNARTLNTLLGQWYAEIKKNCHANELQIFLDIILKIAEKKFDGISIANLSNIASSTDELFIRLSEAAKQIGISSERLKNAAMNGECLYRTRRYGTKGLIYEFPKAEVERICNRRSEWLSDDEAMQTMGVPVSVLRMMCEAEVICSDVKWRVNIYKKGPIEKKSLEELHGRIRTLATQKISSRGECILWSQLNSKNMGDKRAICSAMRAASQGNLKALASGSRLGDLSFLKVDVATFFGRPLLESGMSVQQLAKETGWKWETISYWIEMGFLESTQIKLRGQPCSIISPQQLIKFSQKYIPLADLADAMQTRPSALARRLSSLDILGAKPLPNGRKRGGLVRIADLGRLAIIGAAAISNSPHS